MFFSPELFFLIIALCLDSFVASFALGAGGVRVPWRSVALIGLICSGTLGLALLLGSGLSGLIPPAFAAGLSFAILFILGVTRFLEGGIKKLIRKSQSDRADIRFRFLSFDFLLRVYADGAAADRDHSKVLAPAEAAALSLALSADGLAAGLGAGISGGANVLLAVALSLVVDTALVRAGTLLGRRLRRRELDVSWLSGAVLLALAISKLV